MTLKWREEPISRTHDRKGFDCGNEDLNQYLRRYARQNHIAGGAKTFVAVSPSAPSRILGFYTLSPGALDFSLAPAELTKGHGRYEVPIFRLGRLAVDPLEQGKGLGGSLFLAASERALKVASEIGGAALVIDAKNEAAANWYIRFGSIPLESSPLTLVLPLAVIAKALARSDSSNRQSK